MINTYKLLGLLIAITSMSNTLFAYTYTFTNHTNNQVTVRFKLTKDNAWWQHTLAPGASVQEWFPWLYEKITDWEHNRRANWCMESIEIAQEGVTNSVSKWQAMPIQYITAAHYLNVLGEAKQFANGSGKNFKIQSLVAAGTFNACINRKFDIIQDTQGIHIISPAQ